jgi:hypothetical protein
VPASFPYASLDIGPRDQATTSAKLFSGHVIEFQLIDRSWLRARELKPAQAFGNRWRDGGTGEHADDRERSQKPMHVSLPEVRTT